MMRGTPRFPRRVSNRAAWEATQRSLERSHQSLQGQLRTLTDLRLRGLLDGQEFIAKREELVAKELDLRDKNTARVGQRPDWLELSRKALFFQNHAEKRFRTGSKAVKREILVALGSNLALKDNALSISLHKPFVMEKEGSAFPELWALPDGIRTFFQENPFLIRWPKWCEAVSDAAPVKLPSN